MEKDRFMSTDIPEKCPAIIEFFMCHVHMNCYEMIDFDKWTRFYDESVDEYDRDERVWTTAELYDRLRSSMIHEKYAYDDLVDDSWF